MDVFYVSSRLNMLLTIMLRFTDGHTMGTYCHLYDNIFHIVNLPFLISSIVLFRIISLNGN